MINKKGYFVKLFVVEHVWYVIMLKDEYLHIYIFSVCERFQI